MQSGCGLHDMADIARLKVERGFLKLLLHIAFAKEAPEKTVRIR